MTLPTLTHILSNVTVGADTGKRYLKRTLLVSLGASLLIFSALALLFRSGIEEPIYNGKSYTEWVRQALQLGAGPMVENEQQEAITAIRAMGTNALPYLLQEIAAKYSPVKDAVFRFSPPKVRKKFNLTHTGMRRDYAQVGFRILREHKEKFIPQLLELNKDADLSPTIRPLLESLDRGW